MRNNRLLIIAVILIAIGLLGASMTAVILGKSRNFRDASSMPGMMNMMMDGMMGRGMMDRNQMREMMQRMMPGMLPPGVKPENLPDPKSQGAGLLVRYCGQCHYLPSPQMHSAEEWPLVANRMFARMSMMSGMGGMGMMGIENPTTEEKETILSYLKAHSMKSIAPDALPSPDSRGAAFFKDICTQCHALPDPKLHTAKEWPAVLQRMQTNMQAMGRRVVTEDEKKEIEAYLESHARK